MKYAIDGSNALLGLRINKKPSVRLFARLLHALRERGAEYQLFFDISIHRIMEEEGEGVAWNAFQTALKSAAIKPVFASRADPLIEAFCRAHDAAVINSRDKMDSWNTRPRQIHRVRVYRIRSALHVALLDDETGEAVFYVEAHEPFEFGGIVFPDFNAEKALLECLITPDTQYSTAVAEGTLLVLALDASASMIERHSYDGRPKSEHLNHIVKTVIERLYNSRVGEGLYVAVLRFENDVTPLYCSTGTMFSSVNDWFTSLNSFDYLHNVRPALTNIRLALQRSKEAIQNTLADTESVASLADYWRAAVILITDGNHVVKRIDGTLETDTDVALQALDIHEGLKGLIGGRIDVGCVGIGKDVNRELLMNISSRCTFTQRSMAQRAGIAELLVEDRLCILVDSENEGFPEAVRTFIDVASVRA